MPSYELRSAVEWARIHHNRVPSYSSRKTIPVGASARIILAEKQPDGNYFEEFIWVKIVNKSTARYSGRVKFRPYDLKTVKYRMTIQFMPRHVYAIAREH